MIASVRGEVTHVGLDNVVIEVGGVGVLVHVTPATAATLRLGSTAYLATSLVVREDSLTLFGFGSAGEKAAFELAQTASGVGPKLALAIVSVLGSGDFRRAVQTEDVKRLTAVPGIGLKGAQKIVIELKDKVALLAAVEGEDDAVVSAAPSDDAWRGQVVDGLQGLGWSVRDAEAACDKVAHLVEADPSVGIAQLMRAALTALARR